MSAYKISLDDSDLYKALQQGLIKVIAISYSEEITNLKELNINGTVFTIKSTKIYPNFEKFTKHERLRNIHPIIWNQRKIKKNSYYKTIDENGLVACRLIQE